MFAIGFALSGLSAEYRSMTILDFSEKDVMFYLNYCYISIFYFRCTLTFDIVIFVMQCITQYFGSVDKDERTYIYKIHFAFIFLLSNLCNSRIAHWFLIVSKIPACAIHL